MESRTREKGIIVATDGDCVQVEIGLSSACEGCKIRSRCSTSPVGKTRIVQIYGVNSSRYRVGDVVCVTASTAVGMRAVRWAFGIPLMILLVVLFVTLKMGGGEVAAAVASLAALGAYYTLLYIMRGRIKEDIRFHIEDSVEPMDAGAGNGEDLKT